MVGSMQGTVIINKSSSVMQFVTKDQRLLTVKLNNTMSKLTSVIIILWLIYLKDAMYAAISQLAEIAKLQSIRWINLDDYVLHSGNTPTAFFSYLDQVPVAECRELTLKGEGSMLVLELDPIIGISTEVSSRSYICIT
jgi:hypothetical protein